MGPLFGLLKTNQSVHRSCFLKRSLLASAILSLFLGVSAQAQVCAIHTAQDERGVGGRSAAIEFPNGKFLYIVGHAHGQTSQVLKVTELISDHESSNSDYIKNAKENLAALELTVSDFKEEEFFLKHLLKHKAIGFVGAESGPYIHNFFDSAEKRFFLGAARNFRKRKIWDSNLLNDSQLALLGAARSIRKKQPSLMAGIPIVPIEDEILMEHSGSTRNQAFSLLAKHLGEKSAIAQTWASLYLKYSVLNKLSDKNLEQVLNSIVPESSRQALAPAVSLFKEAIRAIDKRDNINAKNLMAQMEQHKSGIHFIGLAHLESLTKKVSELCLAKYGSPPAEQMNSSEAAR